MNVFKNAPDWAEWFAINSDGMGFYYAIEPIKRNTYWSDGNMNLSCFAGKFDPKEWEVSLQKNMKKIFNSAEPSCHLLLKDGVDIAEQHIAESQKLYVSENKELDYLADSLSRLL